MKFTFNPAPNYKCKLSTQQIMRELAIGLLVIYAFSLFYYGTQYGDSAYVVQALLIMLVSLVSACAVEVLWALATKQNVLGFVKTSFPYITAMIFALMLPINTSLYAVAISSAMAILFGKLVFGGFGQNIFNPAAIGRAVIFAAFTASTTDIVTSVTPTTLMAGQYHWLVTDASLANQLLESVGGLGNLFIGMYPGALGETSALLIGLVGIALAYRKVIDWRVPVVYIGTVFVLTACIAVFTGAGIWYPFYHILSGGLFFGAVFMATDPVTSPTSAAGRCIFALGCGILTVLIRVKANLPEGVLYSILIMNSLSPMIERALDGEQRKTMKKAIKVFASTAVIGLIACLLAISVVEPATASAESNVPSAPDTVEGINGVSDAYVATLVAEVTDTQKNGDETTYTIQADGFAVMNGGDKANVFKVTLNGSNEVVKVEAVEINDTPTIGDKINDEAFFAQFAGVNSADFTVDAVSGATYSSKSAVRAVLAAMEAHGMDAGFTAKKEVSIADDDLVKKIEATVKESKDNGDGTMTYIVDAQGFAAINGGSDLNQFTIVVDANKAVVSVECTNFADTPSIGDMATTAEYLGKFAGATTDSMVSDVVSSATYTSKSVIKAVLTALAE